MVLSNNNSMVSSSRRRFVVTILLVVALVTMIENLDIYVSPGTEEQRAAGSDEQVNQMRNVDVQLESNQLNLEQVNKIRDVNMQLENNQVIHEQVNQIRDLDVQLEDKQLNELSDKEERLLINKLLQENVQHALNIGSVGQSPTTTAGALTLTQLGKAKVFLEALWISYDKTCFDYISPTY
ncbi:unnamed protein product, partial [Meganyctiphanes norvegica]